MQLLLAALLAAGGLQTRDAVDAHLREASPAPERDFRQLIDIVRSALGAQINAGKLPAERVYVSLTAIYADRAVIELAGKHYQYPYTIKPVNGQEQVILGAPVEVVETYVPVAGAAAKTASNVATSSAIAALSEAIETIAPGEVTFREAADGSIEVTLLRAGASGNRNYYPDATLSAAVKLFEGVRVFVKSDEEHLAGKGKAVNNLIGGIYNVRFAEGKTPDTGALVGTFKPLHLADAVVVKMTEAVKRGMQSLMGLSIDAHARTKARTQGGVKLREATQFTKVNSVDLIVEPGAGGGLDRLSEAAAETTTPGENDMLKQRLLEAIKKKDAAAAAKINIDTISDEDLMTVYEAVVGTGTPGAGGEGGAGAGATQRLQEGQSEEDRPVTRAELALMTLRTTAVRRVMESKLPAAARSKLAKAMETATHLTEASIDQAIKDEGAYIAQFTESGAVRVPAFGSISVEDRSVKMGEMLDAFFDPAHKNHRDVHSFKECYIEMTGDRRVTGRLSDVDMGRLRESLGESFVESLTTSSWANALGNSITRRMQAIYTGRVDLQAWRKVATVTSVNDFRTQERMRVGGYGNLPAVAQAAAYAALSSPSDAKATYAATKRGGTEDVTLEMIKNDDVTSIRRIPLELALAAANTLYEFVFDFYRTNPAIYDTVALYHASHANLQTAALDAAAFAAHRLLMVKQTRAGSSKRLGLSPKSVLVPFELQETAYNLFVRNQNLDKTYVQSINPEVIPVGYWTDANDWCTVADPMELPVLEIGFLDGREDPELFVQDMPNVGSMFTNDKTTYKIRHIYGGDVLVDGEKGTTKAVVA